jgi:hypothetical protein
MKYPQIIRDKCLADHKSGFQPFYRSAKHLWLSALFIAPRNKNSLIFFSQNVKRFSRKKGSVFKIRPKCLRTAQAQARPCSPSLTLKSHPLQIIRIKYSLILVLNKIL